METYPEFIIYREGHRWRIDKEFNNGGPVATCSVDPYTYTEALEQAMDFAEFEDGSVSFATREGTVINVY